MLRRRHSFSDFYGLAAKKQSAQARSARSVPKLVRAVVRWIDGKERRREGGRVMNLKRWRTTTAWRPRGLWLGMLLTLVGCSSYSEDCPRDEPEKKTLLFETKDAFSPRLGEPISVYVKLYNYHEKACDQRDGSFQHGGLFSCSCDDPSGSKTEEFELLSAACPNEGCDVVDVGLYVNREIEVRIVPRTSTVTLRAEAKDKDGDKVTGEFLFSAAH